MPVSPSRHFQPDLHAWLGPSSVVLPPPGCPMTATTEALPVSQAFKESFEVRRQMFELRGFGGHRIPGGL